MSIVFNQTASPYRGLVQHFEDEIGVNRGDISGNAEKLAKFTSNCNQALDDFWNIAIPASGTWQLDDSNQTDYPIITTNLVSGQRDYSFTTDGSSNLILDIYRVFILPSATATDYVEISPIDVQSDIDTIGFTGNNTNTGSPSQYDKTANGIFLDPIPSYNATNGLKLYINREASYFTSADTTKKPGVVGTLHKYFYLKPALEYARRNNLANYANIEREIMKLEGVNGRGGLIREAYAYRAKDERDILTMGGIRFR